MPTRAFLAALFLCLSVTTGGAAERGLASWYGGGEILNHRTACGQVFSPWGLTAAHRTLRCGTRVKVVNLKNNRTVYLTISDRGPHKSTGRIIDVTRQAARQLGFEKAGTAKVLVVPLR